MKYQIDKKIIKASDETDESLDHSIVEVITKEEYKQLYGNHPHSRFFLRSIETFQYCKADLFRECIVGTFVIPDKQDLLVEKKEKCFAYYMDRKKLIFVDDSNTVNDIISKMGHLQTMEQTQTAHFLFEFLEYLVNEDIQYLQDYEKRMTTLEETLLNGDEDEKIPKLILTIRKELLRLNSYYSQLIDMSDTLKENYNRILNQEDCSLFMLFSDRVERLADDTKILRELALQILEMYQTQIDSKQNKVMQFLTVVTTIFTPLTLITGWYGMNFINMPELRNEYGYFIVMGISLFIILIGIWYFKKKKWL